MEDHNQLLMIPGPIEIDPNVLSEMNSPMVPHYGEEWTEFYDDTRNKLKDIIGTNNDLFLFVGSGHAALDTAIGSLLESKDNILVLSNGHFGERISEICETYRANIDKFTTEWGEAFNPDKLDDYLAENHQKYKAVLMVHTETSTGVTNPIKELSRVVKKYGLLTFVDAVCSIGVTNFKMDEWNIDICVTASQKGLGAPPGLAIVSVSDKAWEVISKRAKEPTGWYLNLVIMKEYNEKQKGFQPYSITMAVNNVKALNKALKNIEEEGIDNRIKRHDKISKYFRKQLHKLGLETLPAEKDASNAITVIKNPKEYNSKELIEMFKEKYNIRIANGLGDLEGDYVRVGHMNLGASKNSVVPILNAFKEIVG